MIYLKEQCQERLMVAAGPEGDGGECWVIEQKPSSLIELEEVVDLESARILQKQGANGFLPIEVSCEELLSIANRRDLEGFGYIFEIENEFAFFVAYSRYDKQIGIKFFQRSTYDNTVYITDNELDNFVKLFLK